MEKSRDPGVMAAINAASGLRALARLLGCNPSIIARWKRIPAEKAQQVERLTGVPRGVLRPDLFDDAAERKPYLDPSDKPSEETPAGKMPPVVAPKPASEPPRFRGHTVKI